MTPLANLSFHSFPEISGYSLTEQLYVGSRTAVYRAIQIETQCSVVIKVLQRAYPSFAELAQFRNQYAIAKKLNLPGIVRPLSLESLGNGYALVMEDWGGISLNQYIQQQQSFNLSELLAIALQLAELLHDLQQHRVIHKDIKPANILIHPGSKQVKLIDFSIASLLPKETQEIQNPNVLEGTLAYLAPEQTGRMNRGIDYRADFYALGVTLYQLFSGQLPFESSDPMELVHCHIAKVPKPIDQINPSVPSMVAAIVAKLMAKNAEDRYQSAMGLQADLQHCLAQWKETGIITAFELSQRDISDRFLIPERLYGREVEVQTLLDAFERVAQGASELMLVAGLSGIGKTAVVNEVHKPITRQNGYFIKGKFDQFNRNIPLSAFVQALRDLMEQLLSESETQLARWKAQILAAVGENGQVLIEVIPELERIIGQQPAAAELSGTAAQHRFNLLFQKFIQVFTTAAHPLVIFLDDLQWADSASLQLMKVLMPDNGYLLMLGAYRDNEVSPIHPFILTVVELEKAEAIVNTITLAPLALEHTNHLIADTLKCDQELALPLTQLVDRKAQGNPFFTTQFLKALHEDGYITFDHDRGYWQCDMVQVNALALTDDVVEFMALQLQRLPKETQQVLKLAACIGNQFDLATLAIVAEQSVTEVAIALWRALQEGLLLPINETYKFFQENSSSDVAEQIPVLYKFLHDRVQQAAYGLIPEHQKQATHLKIGQLLLDNTPPEHLDSSIFEIVNHLNLGYPADVLQVKEHASNVHLDVHKLIQLNLMAGEKATATIAYEPALTYFSIGIKLLPDQAWQEHYELALLLHVLAMKVSYFISDFSQAEIWMAEIAANARALIDQVDMYEFKILILIAQEHPLKALETGLNALRLLCEDVPKTLTENSGNDIVQYINDYIDNNAGTIANLSQLPDMTCPEALASLRLLDPLFTATYVAAPQLIPFIAALGVKLSIVYGNSSLSILMYTSYGASLCGSPAGMDQGYEFGELALTLLSQINNKEFSAKILCMVGAFILPWKLHLRQSLPLLASGYQNGLESGTLNYTAFNAYHECRIAFFLGTNLTDLGQKLLISTQNIRKMQQTLPLNYTEMIRQVVLNLMTTTDAPWILQGKAYNEQIFLPQYYQSNNREVLHYLHLYKLMMCYLFDNHEVGRNYASQAEDYLDSVPGQLTIPLFYFYGALVHLAGCFQDEALQENHQQAIALATKYGDRLEEYARRAPLNFQHKYNLVQAEKYRVLHHRLEAIEYYDLAIAGAKTNGYIQEEALANELAAKFYLNWGKEKVAAGYMQEAYYGYARWGAKAKTDDLEQRYPQLLKPILQSISQPLTVLEPLASIVAPAYAIHSTSSKSSASDSLNQTLDFATLLQVSQSLASKIELNALLQTLTQTMIENSGADRCALILAQNNQWQVWVMANLEQVTLQSVPLENNPTVPVKLIQYVKNSLTTVVMDDLKTNLSVLDDYLHHHQPKSVLCLPILNQGDLRGILYLENRSTSGVFTRDRILILNFLCTQAAISLENANLYQQAQSYAQQLEQSQLQIVQSEKMASLGNLVAGVAHEINNPIGFLYGSINNGRDYVNDLLEHLALYQQHYPNPVTSLQDHANDIDLEFLSEDLPKLLDSMKGATERITSISTSLRTFSRADTEHKVSANLHEGLDSTLLILKYRLKANEFRPEIEVIKDYGDLPAIECFPGQLNQVFMNIIANAIDMFDEMAQTLSFQDLENNPQQITISTAIADGQARIYLRDNGKGMTEEIKTKIFDHLFTTKGVGKGTGLGLAIARQIIVEKHKGRITCHSTPGIGTKFMIEIPLS